MEHHNELLELANVIAQSMQDILDNGNELSGQLKKSPRVIDDGNEIKIIIDPQIYDINLFKKTKQLKHIKDGSYANYVNDISGGFSGTHLNFVQDAIYYGLDTLQFHILEDNVNG